MTSAGPAFCDAAVPVITNSPAPMIAPIPSVVRFSGPRARLNLPLSASACSSNVDFLMKRFIAFLCLTRARERKQDHRWKRQRIVAYSGKAGRKPENQRRDGGTAKNLTAGRELRYFELRDLNCGTLT